MPNYNDQRLTPTNKTEFFKKFLREANTNQEKALLVVLYYWGCRVSEALALRKQDVIIDDQVIYIRFKRLKGSRQVPPVPLDASKQGLQYLRMTYNTASNKLFPFSRKKAWRICHRFNLYPHFFRMNRIIKDSKRGLAFLKRRHGISTRTMDYYLGEIELTGFEDIE